MDIVIEVPERGKPETTVMAGGVLAPNNLFHTTVCPLSSPAAGEGTDKGAVSAWLLTGQTGVQNRIVADSRECVGRYPPASVGRYRE
jgi:hypothetical protein